MDDAATFEQLQSKLHDIWPTLSPRSMHADDRTGVIVHSISFAVPEHLYPVFPAYEERFLFFVLSVLRQTSGRIVYVTSQPIRPRLIDYFLSMVPGVNLDDVRARLTLVSLSDGTPRPLTEKILARPDVLDRIRRAIPNLNRAMIMPFNVSRLEMELAVQLGIPVYGPDPSLDRWGTKTGSRKIFAEEGVPHALGVEGVTTVNDVVAGIQRILEGSPKVQKVIVKLDRSVSGLGNATVDVARAANRDDLAAAVRSLAPEDSNTDPSTYLAELREGGGIVEELISGKGFRSPSVQMRNSPGRDVEIVSTHDQVLGGPTGQMFLGCRFPARGAYSQVISQEAMKVGYRLAREGVIGRYGIDFVVTQTRKRSWDARAIEINLRNGGTTHPNLTLIALTDGRYDPDRGRFLTPDGEERHYMATDHLQHPAFSRLTPDDLLDLAATPPLKWDAGSLTGPAFHLVSAIAVAGLAGVTAIAESSHAADRLYRMVKRELIREASRV